MSDPEHISQADPDPAREWIIQRCIDAYRNEYEDWPGFFERLMTRDEMMAALKECDHQWQEHEFRGHNVSNQRPAATDLGQCDDEPPVRFV